MKKTILLVAMPESIHVVRWIRQIQCPDWDIHLFPSIGGASFHSDLSDVVFHSLLFPWSRRIGKLRQRTKTPSLFVKAFDFLAMHRILEPFAHKYRAWRLVRVVRKIRPDLVHSLEIQAAAYLILAARGRFRGVFPPWLVTNWGSDIFLFGRLQQHKSKIADVLAQCNFYACECQRDVELARRFGFSGPTMPVFPNTGGFDLSTLEKERTKTRTSARKLIMLKGYQNWAGRALVGLRALSRCEDVLSGYVLCIYLASLDVGLAAELFADQTGIPVRLIPHNTPHQEILSLHAQARISIGLSISDAISTSFLEAMVMGAFPIQSCTACADEWIEHGVGGMIVPPEDPDVIELSIRSALSNDCLVDRAAAINWEAAKERLDGPLVKAKVVEMYSRLLLGGDVGATH